MSAFGFPVNDALIKSMLAIRQLSRMEAMQQNLSLLVFERYTGSLKIKISV